VFPVAVGKKNLKPGMTKKIYYLFLYHDVSHNILPNNS